MHGKVKKVIRDYWNVLCEDGFYKTIQGLIFHVDTGYLPPIYYKLPWYGLHRLAVMRKLVSKLDGNYVVEKDDWPLGALVVLAAKPYQYNLPCYKYQCWLYVSFRMMDQVTRPFYFPIRWCDDALEEIGTEVHFFVYIDMYNGYW